MTEVETVTELTEEMTGTWLITTRGSQHLWDLDKMTAMRQHLDGLNPMWQIDESVVFLRDVKKWPAVGSVFFIWYTHRDGQIHADWLQSSTIRSIERYVP